MTVRIDLDGVMLTVEGNYHEKDDSVGIFRDWFEVKSIYTVHGDDITDIFSGVPSLEYRASKLSMEAFLDEYREETAENESLRRDDKWMHWE